MLKEITKAVRTALKAAYPTIGRNASSVTEGFSRPSFFDSIDNFKADTPDAMVVEYTATVRIIYFPSEKDRNEVELATMASSLSDVFRNNMAVSDSINADVGEFSAAISDGILECSFDIAFSVALPESDTTPLMENIKYNQEVQ